MRVLDFKWVVRFCNNKVITLLLRQKRRIFSVLKKISNYNVITNKIFCLKSIVYKKDFWCFNRCYYNVITKVYLCSNIVITLLFLSKAVCATEVQNNTLFLDVFLPISQGSFVYGKTEEGARVFYQNTPLRLTANGEFVFALPKDAPKELQLIAVKDNYKISKTYDVLTRTWREEVVNGLPPKKVSPSKKDLERITHENALLKKGRESTNYFSFPSCFIRPVDEKARISSEFGSSRVLNGVKTAGHSGTDYALPTGSPIYAPADGEVKVVHNDMFYSGKTILIDHGYGVFSSYSHLSEILVKQGEKINQGHLIGKIGTTGRSTGPHLHLTITWFGVRVDPEYVLKTYACQN